MNRQNRRQMLRLYLGMLLSVLLASLFFSGLYRFNNKYTQHTTQPINGLLILSEADMEQHPSRYLWHDWAYYPNVLLTPADFQDGDPDRYMTYVNLQSGNRMDLSGQSGQTQLGCGTYLLRIQVPSTRISYSLDMPEVFSAYQLYINGDPALSIGNPDPDHYRDATGSRLVSFFPDENGMITILIAVNNQSYFYSGMTFPPAFGTPQALNYTRGIRLGLRLCTIFTFQVAILICGYFWLRTRHKNTALLALLCLLMIGWTVYPLLHTLFLLPVFPTYWLETLCCYGTLTLLLYLHNQVCGIAATASRISCGVAVGICVGVSVYFFGAASIPDWGIAAISRLLAGYKLLLSAYLIFTAFLTARKSEKNHRLFYVSLFFGCACLWDRIYPAYDPIFGGWFLEWVCTVLIYMLATMLWKFLAESYTQNRLLQQQNHNAEKQLIMQTNYTFQLREQVEIRRRFVHDFRHHLRTLHTLAEQTGDQVILEYLDSVGEYSSGSGKIMETYCGRPAVDALLFYYDNLAEIRHINLSLQFQIPEPFSMTDVELCTLLGNLLENAVEACLRMPPEATKRIRLKTACKPAFWYMVIENTYNGMLAPKEQQGFFTRKNNSEYHGIGLSSAMHLVEKHKGTLDVQPSAELFRVGIMIPIEK